MHEDETEDKALRKYPLRTRALRRKRRIMKSGMNMDEKRAEKGGGVSGGTDGVVEGMTG